MKFREILEALLGYKVSFEIRGGVLFIKKGKKVHGIKYLVSNEVDYGFRDLDPNRLYRIVETYASLYSRMPVGTEIKIVKLSIDKRKLLKRIENEMLNIRAVIDTVKEPHTIKKQELRLKLLERLYEKIIASKDIERIILIIKIRSEGTSIDSVKESLDTLSEMIISFFKLGLGVILRSASDGEVREIIRYELGIVEKPRGKPIIIETQKLASLQPIPFNKKPSIEEMEGIYIGNDLESGWPIIIDKNALSKHIAVIGPTGKGKTVTLATIIESMIALGGSNIIAIDFKGDLVPLVNKNLISILEPNSLPLNILIKPDYIPRVDWALIVNDLLINVMKIDPKRSSAILSAIVEGKIDSLNAEKILLNRDLAILANVIELVTSSSNYSKLYDLLIRGSILFSLKGYGTTFQNMYGGLVLSIISYLVSIGRLQRSLVIIDEAWRIMRIRSFRTLVKEGRSRGVGVIYAVQNIEDIPEDILDNTNTIIAFGSYSDNYIDKIRRVLGLNRQYLEKMKHLSVGEAVMITSIDPHPLVIRIEPPSKLEEKIKASKKIKYIIE